MKFHLSRMTPEESDRFLRQYSNVYDWSIFRADRELGDVLNRLRVAGRLNDDYRLVVTSDHGEFLGEHGILGHCCWPYEDNARIPLIYREEVL